MALFSLAGKNAGVVGGAGGLGQAIAQGLARDGGLLTPEVFPKLTPALLEDLRGKTYGQRAVAVMKLFLAAFSEEELPAFTQAG